MKPSANSSGVLKRQLAAPHGGQPVEELDAGRDRDEEREEAEERQVDRAGGEHVVRPDREAEGADRRGGEDERLVAEERLAREHRQDLASRCRTPAGSGCTPRGGRRTRTRAATGSGLPPSGGLEEAAAVVAVDEQHHQAGRQHRHRRRAAGRWSPACSRRTCGMRSSVMPGARILKIVAMKLIAPSTELVPEQRSGPATTGRRRCRRPARTAARSPSSRRRPRRQQRSREKSSSAAQRDHPERQRVDARERHVRGADLQRHDVVRQARRSWA